jgi:acyl-CoA thioester hydrolase
VKRISYIQDYEEWKDGFSFSISIKVRFSETDMYGHVNNTSVFVYFEEARIEYLNYLSLFSNDEREKYGVIVADLQCDFLKQMYFGEILEFYVKVHTVGTTSFDLHYMAVNEKEEVAVTGRGRLVMIDVSEKKPVPIPDAKRMRLEEEMNKQKVS